MDLQQLQTTYAQTGCVQALCLRPARKTAAQTPNEVWAVAEQGLRGDRYANRGGNRQVTLIQAEHVQAVASFLGRASIDFALTRRNILVSGLNLLALKGSYFEVGEALLQYTGECHPCSRMEEVLGAGGYNAMRGHGGITAKVIRGSKICQGDSVRAVMGPVHSD